MNEDKVIIHRISKFFLEITLRATFCFSLLRTLFANNSINYKQNNAEGRKMKRETSGTYLLWEPRRHERHLEGVAVRVKRVEGIGVHGAEHGENTARKLLTYCNRRKATLGCASFRLL